MRSTGHRWAILLLVLAILLPGAAGLAADDEVKESIEAFKKAMKSKEERDRIRAINQLATINDKKVSKELKNVVRGDRSERVSAAAAQAIGKLGNDKDLAFLTGSIRSLKKRPLVLAGVCDAIGDFRNPKTADPLFDVARSWMSKHKYPAMAAIRSLGDCPSRKAIENLIDLFELTFPRSAPGHSDGTTYYPPAGVSDETQARMSDYRPYVVKSLQKLTGEQITDLDIWKEWWEDNGKTFNPGEVQDDPNSMLRFVDDEFRYQISRPNEEWKWIDKPESGFTRTAELGGDSVVGRVSILTYSVWSRTPSSMPEMATKQKKLLKKEFAFVKEQKWDVTLKMGKTDEQEGADAIRQTIAGVWDDVNARLIQTIFVHRGIMYVIRVTQLPGLSHSGIKDTEKFVESFKFLL